MCSWLLRPTKPPLSTRQPSTRVSLLTKDTAWAICGFYLSRLCPQNFFLRSLHKWSTHNTVSQKKPLLSGFPGFRCFPDISGNRSKGLRIIFSTMSVPTKPYHKHKYFKVFRGFSGVSDQTDYHFRIHKDILSILKNKHWVICVGSGGQ